MGKQVALQKEQTTNKKAHRNALKQRATSSVEQLLLSVWVLEHKTDYSRFTPQIFQRKHQQRVSVSVQESHTTILTTTVSSFNDPVCNFHLI